MDQGLENWLVTSVFISLPFFVPVHIRKGMRFPDKIEGICLRCLNIATNWLNLARSAKPVNLPARQPVNQATASTTLVCHHILSAFLDHPIFAVASK